MTPRNFVLDRIYKGILSKLPDCNIKYDKPSRRIFYSYQGWMNYDVTEPLEALYHYFADIENEHWREKLAEKFAVPMDMMFPKKENFKTEGKYKFIIDKKPRVYLSGKVSGLDPKVYKNNFNTAELYLTGLGYDVVNPVSYTAEPNWKWEDYMKRDIKLLVGCDYIYMLEGWEDSDGASLEKLIADNLKIKELVLDE